MSAKSRTQNNPKNPSELQREEIEAILLEVAEALRDSKTVEDRREMIARLMARGAKRGRIIRIISKAYGVKPGTIDQDMTIVREWWLKAADLKRREAIKGECVATMDEVVALGFTRGDLGAIVQAVKHKAQLTGLTDESLNLNGSITFEGKEDELRAQIAGRLARIAQSGSKGKVPPKPKG